MLGTLDDNEVCRRLAAMRALGARPTASSIRLERDAQRSVSVAPIIVLDGDYGPELGETIDEPTGGAAAGPDFGLPRGAASFTRWPATLHPDAAERCYYSARAASMRWVGELRTRTGTLRWDRIRRCGDPVAVMRLGDGAVSWQHRWCRDRACFACAKSRSRRTATELRAAVDTRPARRLYFLTLTQPKLDGESCNSAWSRWLKSWTALRHSPAFEGLRGGVRVVEVTYGRGHARAQRQVAGWHVHGHLVVELRDDALPERCPTCNGTKRYNGSACRTCGSRVVPPSGALPDAIVALLAVWCGRPTVQIRNPLDGRFGTRVPMVGPVRWLPLAQAQCAVPLDARSTGQLAKYLTKLWELRDDHARELFAAADGRRLIDGFGTWRSWRQFQGKVESTPHGWIACGVPLRTIEAMPADASLDFSVPIGITMEADGRPRWRPQVAVARLTAADVVAALRRDARPVWVRVVDPAPPSTAIALARLSASLSRLRREHHRGLLGSRSEQPPWPSRSP